MGVPNDRRIFYSTSVESQESYLTTDTEETLENGETVGVAAYTDYKLDTTVGKLLGGTGNVDDITEAQGRNDWASMVTVTWESMTEHTWTNQNTLWGREVDEIDITGETTLRNEAVAVKFLYVKNTGADEVKLALDSGTEYDILIPPGASVAMRVNNAVVTDASDIKVTIPSGSSTIEYIVAK